MHKKLTFLSLLLSCAILVQSAMAVDHVHLALGAELDCAVCMSYSAADGLMSDSSTLFVPPSFLYAGSPDAIVVARSVALQKSRSPPSF